MKKKLFYALSVLSVAAFLTACDSEQKNARVEVWLTDAAGDYQEVNIEVLGVEVNASQGENGWQSLAIDPGVINLLELTNGLDTLLGVIEIPAGKIEQVRLKLGENNTLKVGNEFYDLRIPSGSQSGLKINVHQTLSEGITYKILLDFDAAKSIVRTGAGQYKLKPVIKAITQAQNGAIKGVVDPAASTPAIYAMQEDDTVGSTYSDSTGHFLLRGLPVGTYSVLFAPDSGYQVVEKTNVGVQLGVVTDLGTVEIPNE